MDVSRYEPLVEEFHIKVIEPLSKQPSTVGKRKSPSSNNEGEDGKKPEGFALPNIIEISKDNRTGHNWSEQSFNEYSALKVKGNKKDGYDFYINIDNIHLLSELKLALNTEMQAIHAKYKFGLVLIGLALLNDYEQKSNMEDGENIYTMIYSISKAISPIIIPMIDSLGALELQDIYAMPEEQQ